MGTLVTIRGIRGHETQTAGEGASAGREEEESFSQSLGETEEDREAMQGLRRRESTQLRLNKSSVETLPTSIGLPSTVV